MSSIYKLGNAKYTLRVWSAVDRVDIFIHKFSGDTIQLRLREDTLLFSPRVDSLDKDDRYFDLAKWLPVSK